MTQKDWYEAAGQQFFEELKQVRAQRDALLEACEAAQVFLETWKDALLANMPLWMTERWQEMHQRLQAAVAKAREQARKETSDGYSS